MYTYIDGGVCAARGFTAAGLHCGLRKNKTKKDLCLIVSEKARGFPANSRIQFISFGNSHVL